MTSAGESRREWNATEYHRLANPHVTWGRRVLARLPLRGDETVVDAGCGSGRLTAELVTLLPDGRVIAVDQSANMLAEARQHLDQLASGRVTYLQTDLETLTLETPVHAIFSTAALHWVRDHQCMFEHFFAALRPGGWLVAQCGGGPNIAGLVARAHDLMRSARLAYYFDGWNGPWEFASADVTENRLRGAGFIDVATSLEDAPVTLADAGEYRDYLETVVFGTHLARIPEQADRAWFLDELTARASADPQPFLLDYWRLNIRARRPR